MEPEGFANKTPCFGLDGNISHIRHEHEWPSPAVGLPVGHVSALPSSTEERIRCLVWKEVFSVIVVPLVGSIRFGADGDGHKWHAVIRP